MLEAFIRFITFDKRYSAHTVTSYTTDLLQFSDYLRTTFNTTELQSADYNMLRAWVVSLINGGLETRTINRKIACLKSFYKYLQKQGLIERNPASRIKTPKVKKRLPVFVETTATERLFEEFSFASDFIGFRDWLVLELLYGTGIRLAELLGLKWTDIDLHRQTLRVLGKGKKERIIPIHQKLQNLIVNYNNQKVHTFKDGCSDYLIVSDKGGKPYPVLIQRIVKKYLQGVTTLEKKSPHVLRHTFATHMLNNGADLNAIKELLGHSSLAATQIYTHNSLEKLKQIFNQAHPKA